MSLAPNIKFVLIGNTDKNQIVTEFVTVKIDKIRDDSRLIFQKICGNETKNKFYDRKKIQMTSGYAYFITYPENKAYCVVAESSYPERFVFEMIENIEKDNIFLLTNEKGELNANGKQLLKQIVEKYQEINKVNKIQEINNDIDIVKRDMQENIKKTTDNIVKVKDLDEKAFKIKLNADSFKNDSKKLERTTCIQNWKWTIILILVVIILLSIFIFPHL